MIRVQNNPLMQEKNPMRKRNTQRRPGGFTLMEIMLVMAILVVLASASGLAYMSFHKRALKSAAKDGIRTVEIAVDAYLLDNGHLPENLTILYEPADQDERYLNAPAIDPWGQEYYYEQGAGEDFVIRSNGPDKTQGGDDDVRSSKETQNANR